MPSQPPPPPPSSSFSSAAQLPRASPSPPRPRPPTPLNRPGQSTSGTCLGQGTSLRNAAASGSGLARSGSGPPGPPAGVGAAVAPAAAAPKPVVQHAQATSAIVVSSRQRGNPIIPHIKGIKWEYGDIVPDYVVGAHTCVCYLSLRYHRLHPEYLHGRIEKLGPMYELRVLLVHCDIADPQESIREITKICLINNMTVVVAWTPEEAGQYLSTYKRYEHKSPDILKERVSDDYRSQLHRALTSVRGVNKTDVLTLSTSFGSFDRMVKATPEELSLCPGLGDVKVRRLLEAFSTPFRGGPPPSAQKGTQRALDELSATKGKDKAREPSPDWPSSGNEEEKGLHVAQVDVVAEGKAANAREPSPDWPSSADEEDGRFPKRRT